jgi:uncharacterized RDD family membrane protein YckC
MGECIMMDQEPDQNAGSNPESSAKHVIPPPDVSKRPPPPPSPIESLPKSSPPPSLPVGDPSARVKLRKPGDPVDETESGMAGPQVAQFNPRVMAALIDLGVGLGVTIALSWLLPDFATRLAQFAGMAYFVTRDSLPFLGGQGIGKKAMKLKVSTLNEKSLVGNWQAALIRNGILLIPLFALVELYILLSRENGVDRGRRLGDEWAKTRVFVEETPVSEEESP